MPRKKESLTIKPGKVRDYVTLGEIIHQKGGAHQDKRKPNRRNNQTARWQKEDCKSDPPSAMLA